MRPAQLYYESSNAENVAGLVQGFGYTDHALLEIAIILKNMVQIGIAKAECQDLLGSRSSIVTESHFCAIDRIDNASACVFDNGNGFIVNANNINYVVGVLSLVTNMCRPEFPALYTRVGDYTEWIDDYLELWR